MLIVTVTFVFFLLSKNVIQTYIFVFLILLKEKNLKMQKSVRLIDWCLTSSEQLFSYIQDDSKIEAENPYISSKSKVNL